MISFKIKNLLTSQDRTPTIFIICSYLALSLTPFLSLAFNVDLTHPLWIGIFEITAWLIVWCLFKRPIWFHLLLLPAFLFIPLELYLYVFYGQRISTHHLGIILETSPIETLEFLGTKIGLLFFSIIFVLSWWCLVFYAAKRTKSLALNLKARLIIFTTIAFFSSVFGYANFVGIDAVKTHSASTKSTNSASLDEESDSSHPPPVIFWGKRLPLLPYWMSIPADKEILASTWPFGLYLRAYDFWKEREYFSELGQKNSLFTFGAHHKNLLNTSQTVVMVIGESSRYDRWGINGYQRQTTPNLSKETNLVSFSNVVTAVSATRLSVPVLISRKPARQSLTAGFSEKSFLTAFKEAGFKTFWLSNQLTFGQFDTPISVFAKEADITQFLNLGGFTNNSNFDQVLLEPLQTALNEPSQKKLIVLHTLGNHWNYSHRHPKEFDKWQPSLFGIDNPVYTDLKIKEQLNNSYDNSILYTDWFLAKLIDMLKQSKQITSMVYVSDHGQTLYDGTCNLAFHGHNTQFEFHIPAFVWYSDEYKQVYPYKVKQVLKNRRAKLATENIFHSLVDMADISYTSEQLEWSFFSKKFKQHKRYVDSYGWTDYDNAVFKGDCREVIDKGTPLKRD